MRNFALKLAVNATDVVTKNKIKIDVQNAARRFAIQNENMKDGRIIILSIEDYRIKQLINQKKEYSTMSITISNCAQICNSPANNSASKMLYSFSKGERFVKHQQILCQKFYTTSFDTHARTTTFGFGNKYDFSKTPRLSPSCNTYNLSSQFDMTNTDRKGFGFGKGREEMLATGPMVMALKNKNPGPNSYKLPSTLQKLTYSFTSRIQIHNKQKEKIPGPGHYPVTLSINQKGKYPVSKLKNIMVRNFSTTLGRMDKMKSECPPPGSYDFTKTSFSPDGKYPLSKMENVKVRKFGSSLRSSLADKKQTPGPGNYKLPSDFGHYVSSKWKEGQQRGSPKENKQNVPTSA